MTNEAMTDDALSHAWKSGYAQAKEEDALEIKDLKGQLALATAIVEREGNRNDALNEAKDVIDEMATMLAWEPAHEASFTRALPKSAAYLKKRDSGSF